MAGSVVEKGWFRAQKESRSSNVKSSAKYERFGESIRYLTWEEWQRFLDAIDNYKHKLMMRTIYELGCRDVGRFAHPLPGMRLSGLRGLYRLSGSSLTFLNQHGLP